MYHKFYVIDNIRFFTLESKSLVSDGMPHAYNSLGEVIDHFNDIQVSLNSHNRSLIRLWTDDQLFEWWKLRENYLEKYNAMLEASDSKDKNNSFRYIFQGKWLIKDYLVRGRFSPRKKIPNDFWIAATKEGYSLIHGEEEDGKVILRLKRAIVAYMMLGL